MCPHLRDSRATILYIQLPHLVAFGPKRCGHKLPRSAPF